MSFLQTRTPQKQNIGEILELLSNRPLPFRVTAYDGSDAGSQDAGIGFHIADESALRYMVTAPGDLGLARAYVTGGLQLSGVHPANPYEAFKKLREGGDLRRPTAAEMPGIVSSLGADVLRPMPEPPAVESLPRWRRHAEKLREAAGLRSEAISHHYDVSNEFYEKVLGPSMAYTCAVYTTPEDSLDAAQTRKFDLVANKLALKPGMRLLDVGCGWGSMAIHAAQHYGAEAVGVTLSEQQAKWGQATVEELGLTDRVRIIHGDYRDVTETDFDAISSIGLIEHLGVDNYPSYFDFLHGKVREGGRFLQHNITRRDDSISHKPQAFIDRYVFPDGELASPSAVMAFAHNAGFDVEHSENLRSSYALTLQAWCANLEEHWDECVEEVGLERAKVWGLYMAGSRLGFEWNWIQLHQYLLYKPYADGTTDFPLRPDWRS